MPGLLSFDPPISKAMHLCLWILYFPWRVTSPSAKPPFLEDQFVSLSLASLLRPVRLGRPYQVHEVPAGIAHNVIEARKSPLPPTPQGGDIRGDRLEDIIKNDLHLSGIEESTGLMNKERLIGGYPFDWISENNDGLFVCLAEWLFCCIMSESLTEWLPCWLRNNCLAEWLLWWVKKKNLLNDCFAEWVKKRSGLPDVWLNVCLAG